MTSIDILFWLLAVLLAGLIWAVEAGLTSRHRSVVLSSMGVTLISMLFMMFWIEDNTKLKPFDPEKFAKKEGMQGEGSVKKEGSAGGGGKGGDGREDDAADANGEGGGGGRGGNGRGGKGGTSAAAGGGSSADQGTEYSREPFRDCAQCPDMVIMPKGIAQVGSPASDPGRLPDEPASASIPLAKPFAIGRLEVLRKEFAQFAQETSFKSTVPCDVGKRRGIFSWERPGFEQDERHPAVCLTAQDVRVYLAWLSEKSGRTYRLPTDVEWEYAARAGTDTPYSIGHTVNRTQANVGRTRDGTTVTATFTMNRWGLSDMIGNVWEMTSSCAPEPDGAARRPDAACKRIIKGGAWSSAASLGRHAARRIVPDGAATNDIGFRVVRDVDQLDADKILTPAQKRALEQDEKVAQELVEKDRAEAERVRLAKLEEEEAARAKKEKEEAAKKAEATKKK